MCPPVNVSSLPPVPPAPPMPEESARPLTHLARTLARVRNASPDAERGEQTRLTTATPTPLPSPSLCSALLDKINDLNARQDDKKRTALCNALASSGVANEHIKAAYDEVTNDRSALARRAGNARGEGFTDKVANAYLLATGETLSVKSPEVQALAQRVMVLSGRGEIDQTQRDNVFNKLQKVGLEKPAAYVEEMVASVVKAIKTVTASDVHTAICTGLVAVMKQQGIARVDEQSLTVGLDYFERLLHKIDVSQQGASRETAMNTALDALRYFILPPAPSDVDTADNRAGSPSSSVPPAQPDGGTGASDAPLSVQEEEGMLENAASPSGIRRAFPRSAIPREARPENDERVELTEPEPAQPQPSALKREMARVRAQMPVGRENPAEVSVSPEKNLQIHIHNNHSWSHHGVPMPPPNLESAIASVPPVQTAQPVQPIQAEPVQRVQTGPRAPFSVLVKAGRAMPPPAPSLLAALPNSGINERASFQEKLAFFRAREATALSPEVTSRTFKHAIVASDRYISATSGIQGREIQRHRQKNT